MRISLRVVPIVAFVMIDSKKIRDLYRDEKDDKNYAFFMKPVPKNFKLLEQAKA
jgi:hypothetical protein